MDARRRAHEVVKGRLKGRQMSGGPEAAQQRAVEVQAGEAKQWHGGSVGPAAGAAAQKCAVKRARRVRSNGEASASGRR